MAVMDVVQGTVRDGVRRSVVWGLQRQGDVGAGLMDERVRAHPYPRYAQIRAAGALVESQLGWYAAGHAAVSKVLRDPTFGHGDTAGADTRATGFVAAAMQPVRPPGLVDPVGPESMIGMDPPDHTRLRRLVSKVFTPTAIEALRPRLTDIAEELLAGPSRAVSFDLMRDVAGALPVLAICEVLGIPSIDRGRFKAWGGDIAVALDLTAPAAAQRRADRALAGLHRYFEDLFAQRRAAPGDDLVSELLAVEEQGDALTPRELMATCLLLLLAGFETTVNLLGNGTLALLDHPGELERLRADRSLLPGAVEEMLRYDAPVQLTARQSLRDTEVEGVDVPAGRFVITLVGGANRDPAVFADPDRFDITRRNARQHLSFIVGAHHCLGAALARLEGEVTFAALLDHLPDLRAAGPARRRPTFVLRGLESLPLVGGARPGRPDRRAVAVGA